ncbi:MAG: hypothetical protein M0Z60_11740 [Nitrospiraceae bacterium]|nr:hypothetical protein [Nitrospiraceae bacterium]
MKKGILWAIVFTMVVVGLAACGGSSNDSPAVPPKSFDALSLDDIKVLTLSSSNIDGSNNSNNMIPAGTIVVYHTNEGRYGKLLVVQYDSDLTIKWVTYNADGSVHSQGDNFVVPATWLMDLDEGALVGTFPSADFWWEGVDSVTRYFVPENGATFAVYK